MYSKITKHFNRRNMLSALAVAFIIYAAVATIGVIGRNYRLQQEVDNLANEIEVLKLKNTELEYRIAYYKTDAFADKEARDKLGLQAPGEHVLIFPDKIPQKLEEEKTQKELVAEKSFNDRAKYNFQQWKYFLLKSEPQ